MKASAKLLVVLGVVTSPWLVGCSSKPVGGLPTSRTSSQSDTVSEAATSSESTGESSATAEVGTDRKPDDRVGSKITPPIIGQLKSRHHTILIHVGSDGPRFTVSTLDGKVVAAALTMDEMHAQHPEIYKLYKDTFAKEVGSLDASNYLDARSPAMHAPTGRR
jgi:hypothetical protein